MKLHFSLIYLFWQVLSVQLFAQSSEYIYGKILNSNTKEPLPFATIALKGNQLGVFANAEGDFRIIRNAKFQSDSLIITCIGFRRTAVLLKDLSITHVNNIYLTPAFFIFSEVIIVGSSKKINPKAIIRKAIGRIPQNYPVNPFSYVAYYRDYQKKEKEYINLNEAIIQTNDYGFNKESILNITRLLDYRKNRDFKRMYISPYYDTIPSSQNVNQNKYIPGAKLPDQGGNELFILMTHDAIRNFKLSTFSFIYTFSRDFLSNHTFGEITPMFNNNVLLYKISFKAKPGLTRDTLLVSGNIYIQPKDYSIHKLEYSCSYLPKGKEKKEMFNVTVEYGYQNNIDSLMHLKYISFRNVFNLIDITDTTFFRINDSYLIDNNTAMVFNFNHKIDPESAYRRASYKITRGKKIIKVKNIKVEDNRLIINIDGYHNSVGEDHFKVNMENIKDIDERILNVKKTIEFFQYRELFVQEVNNQIAKEDSCCLRNIPLLQNCISKYSGDKKYWMNTPGNIIMDK